MNFHMGASTLNFGKYPEIREITHMGASTLNFGKYPEIREINAYGRFDS